MSSNYNSFSPNAIGLGSDTYVTLHTGDALVATDVELKNKTCDNVNYDFYSLDPLDLTGIESALLKIRLKNTINIVTTIIGTVLAPYTDGFVNFVWLEHNLDIYPGLYEGEIELSYSNGRIETVRDLTLFNIVDDF